MAGWPGTLIWFFPTVQFHVVVQGPFFTEGALAQLAFELPVEERGHRRSKRRQSGTSRKRKRGEKKKNEELFTDPKADIKHWKIYAVRKEMEVAGYSRSKPQSTEPFDCALYVCADTHTRTHKTHTECSWLVVCHVCISRH